ncbi:MAG: hypothetical protein IH624_11160 [Phycisphaerae bacterium]|nr:hypothetical protein [Phycisphaerae bacterium]
MCKVAHDAGHLYFYVKTQAPLTPHTDPNWMLLFLDTDQNSGTGWEGYDYLVNYGTIGAGTTMLQKTQAGWNWKDVERVAWKAKGCELELRIPLKSLGLKGAPAVDFHWADNIQKGNDIVEFAVSGDSAPNRRFNYRFQAMPE